MPRPLAPQTGMARPPTMTCCWTANARPRGRQPHQHDTGEERKAPLGEIWNLHGPHPLATPHTTVPPSGEAQVCEAQVCKAASNPGGHQAEAATAHASGATSTPRHRECRATRLRRRAIAGRKHAATLSSAAFHGAAKTSAMASEISPRSWGPAPEPDLPTTRCRRRLREKPVPEGQRSNMRPAGRHRPRLDTAAQPRPTTDGLRARRPKLPSSTRLLWQAPLWTPPPNRDHGRPRGTRLVIFSSIGA